LCIWLDYPGRARFGLVNGSKSNEIKVVMPADGQPSVSLQLGPGQGKPTFMYFFHGFVNCANYGADQNLLTGRQHQRLPLSAITELTP